LAREEETNIAGPILSRTRQKDAKEYMTICVIFIDGRSSYLHVRKHKKQEEEEKYKSSLGSKNMLLYRLTRAT